jgi:hypothetical protein
MLTYKNKEMNNIIKKKNLNVTSWPIIAKKSKLSMFIIYFFGGVGPFYYTLVE